MRHFLKFVSLNVSPGGTSDLSGFYKIYDDSNQSPLGVFWFDWKKKNKEQVFPECLLQNY